MVEYKISEFLKRERISCLTTLLVNKTPHSAALHYSHSEDPLKFYFSTENTSRKCEALLTGEVTQASLVMGFSEKEWITLQLEGTIQIISDKDAVQKIKDIHYAKHPNSKKFENDPATVFLEFIPTWWRYTDFNTDPVTLISSE